MAHDETKARPHAPASDSAVGLTSVPAVLTTASSGADVQAQAVRALTAERKLELAFALRELAWELKALGIRTQHPGMPDAEVQERVRAIFLYART